MGTINSKPPSPIIMIDPSEILNRCQGKLHKFGAENPISRAKLAHFDIFALNFNV
jgi:hypothetical protein